MGLVTPLKRLARGFSYFANGDFVGLANGGTGRIDGGNLVPPGGSTGQVLAKTGVGDYATAWAKATNPWHPGYVAGEKYLPPFVVAAGQGNPNSTASGVPTGRLWVFPALIPYRIQIDQLAAAIAGNADSAGTFLLAVYAAGSSPRLPTTLLAQTSAGGSTAAVGVVNLSLAAATWLDPGIYWFAFQSNCAATCTFTAIALQAATLPWLVGGVGGDALTAVASTSPPTGLAYANTYGSWPADLSSGTPVKWPLTGSPVPAIQFRVSAVG